MPTFYNDPMLNFNRAVPTGRIRLLVFDLDGTLIDSREDLTNCINAMLRHLGRNELPTEVISSYIGDGAPMLVRRALGDPDDQQLFESGLDYFLSFYREHKLDHTRAYEGIHDALRSMQRHSGENGRLTSAILTNKPVNPSRQIVQALGLAEFFAQVYGGNSFATKKPDPLGIQTLMKEFQVTPDEVLMIGDTDIDTLTGRNVGAWTCGVRYGFDPSRLELVPPDILVDVPGDLPLIFAPGNRPPLEAHSLRDILA